MNPKQSRKTSKKTRRVITVTGETYTAVRDLKASINHKTGGSPNWTLSDVIRQCVKKSAAAIVANAPAKD